MPEITLAEVRKTHRDTLMRYKQARIPFVEIVTADDEHVCDYCEKHAGLYKIGRVPPLPHKGCTASPLTKKTEGKTWCRCCYAPIYEPEEMVQPNHKKHI